MKQKPLSRRTVLRGLGTALGVPLLDAMTPAYAAGTRAAYPLRMAFMFFPNGVIKPDWTPEKEGTDFALPFILTPLEKVRKDVLVMTGLAQRKADANGDGPGDHARSAGTFLTSMQAFKTAGKDIRVGISVDQIAAQKIGGQTPLPSLELGTEPGAQAGNCDSGYSCAYSSCISWSTPNTPVTKEVNPRAVFARLFGDPEQAAAARDRAKRAAYERSILDLVREDAETLNGKLGGSDKRKMDEYLDSVRSIEKRIQAMETKDAGRKPPPGDPPTGIPREYPEHVRVMNDLMVLAFQTDSTRVASFMLANEGSNRTYPFLEVREGWHSLSHHQNKKNLTDQIRRIDKWNVEQFVYLVEKLKSVPEGNGTLLDSCMVLYGCAIGDGNRHSHNDLPILLAGKAGGTIATGRHVQWPKNTPLANLFLSMLDRMGVKEASFGDSTGRLDNLTA